MPSDRNRRQIGIFMIAGTIYQSIVGYAGLYVPTVHESRGSTIAD